MMGVLRRVGDMLAGLSGWRRSAVLVAAGAISTMAFAPFHQFWVLWFSFAVLMVLLDRSVSGRQAFFTGFWFGYGQFIAGLYWITSAFLVDAAAFAWLIPLPLLGLPAVLAVFVALPCFLSWRLSSGPGIVRLLMFAACWTLGELARGYMFTGFPWNLMGYATGVHVAAMQPVAWVGIYTLSFLVVLAAGGIGLLIPLTAGQNTRRRTVPALLFSFGIPVLIVISGALRLQPAFTPDDAPVVRVVQANIPQAEKWAAEFVNGNFLEQVRMSDAPGNSVTGRPDIVIWPETAATFYLSHDQQRLAQLQALAGRLSPRGVVITGALHAEPVGNRARPDIYNAAYAVTGRTSIPPAIYAKQHLVPFGEYLPFRPVLSLIGLKAIAETRGDFSSGSNPQMLEFDGLPAARVLICYEAIFPEEVALGDTTDRPRWLINLTNDAWFGALTGPYQHFDMARFRAVEQGAPMVRAAGTGISGLIDPYGRIVAYIGLEEKGTADFKLPTRLDRAPLPSGINLVLLATLLIVVAAGALASRLFVQRDNY